MAQVNDIGIDVGTSNILIYMKGRGIVLREPAVVAIQRDTRRVLAVGSDAYRMIGRTPTNVLAVRPLQQGTVIDSELADVMLRSFVATVVGKHLFAHPRAIVSLPSGVNTSDQRMIISTMFDAGVRRTQLLEKTVAAAIGAGLDMQQAYGSMIVDMGAGVTEIGVLSRGEVIVSSCVPIGGDLFDEAIIQYLRKKHNLLIGERTAEEIKIDIGTAIPQPAEMTIDVTGRYLLSGLPKTMTITSSDVYEALKEPIADLIEAIQTVIERTPPQLASDIFEDGIIFTGGCAALTGLSDAVYAELKIPCTVADDPQTCVVMGCGHAVESPATMRMLLQDSRKGWH